MLRSFKFQPTDKPSHAASFTTQPRVSSRDGWAATWVTRVPSSNSYPPIFISGMTTTICFDNLNNNNNNACLCWLVTCLMWVFGYFLDSTCAPTPSRLRWPNKGQWPQRSCLRDPQPTWFPRLHRGLIPMRLYPAHLHAVRGFKSSICTIYILIFICIIILMVYVRYVRKSNLWYINTTSIYICIWYRSYRYYTYHISIHIILLFMCVWFFESILSYYLKSLQSNKSHDINQKSQKCQRLQHDTRKWMKMLAASQLFPATKYQNGRPRAWTVLKKEHTTCSTVS